jgi:hypothetical protein
VGQAAFQAENAKILIPWLFLMASLLAASLADGRVIRKETGLIGSAKSASLFTVRRILVNFETESR